MPQDSPNAQHLSTTACVVGAGPSGAAASLMLSKMGIPHVVTDKAEFPRDKTCGDGLILYAFKALKLIDPALLTAFLENPKFIHASSGKFHVSDRVAIDVEKGQGYPHAPIAYGKRYDFDHFLVQRLPSPYARLLLGKAATGFQDLGQGGIQVQLSDGSTVTAQIVLGADGINSLVSRKLGRNRLDKTRTSVFISAYFKGLQQLSPGNGAEIRLVYRKMPLFFYIFPLPNGEANVSLGGLSSEVGRLKLNLKAEVMDIIRSHPQVAHKFEQAERLGNWRGWGIPCHFGHLRVSGNRFMLLGDAAGLANAFYKEGVGTGMMSGVIAAQKVQQCLEKGDFSAGQLADYETQLRQEFGRLLLASKAALRLSRNRRLFAAGISLVKSRIERKISDIIDSRTYTV